MKLGQKVRTKQQRKRGGNRTRLFGTLVANKAFAPILGLWGALLGGLVIMVLPPVMIGAATKGTLIATFDMPTQAAIASCIALMLGTVLFLAAAAKSTDARRHSQSNSIAGAISRRVRPIDPVRDLGTRSLDDPIETMPFATPAWRDAAVSEPAPAPASVAMRDPGPEPKPEPVAAPVVAEENVPLALDLAQFAELPGRNAVWVEEPLELSEVAALTPVVTPAPAPVAVPVASFAPERAASIAELRRAAPPPPQPGTAALTRLRALPTSELSLVEMVERFAGALHEHRAGTPAHALSAEEIAARGTALSEALKALAALSGDFANRAAADDRVQEPLRAALSQLQPRRGAA